MLLFAGFLHVPVRTEYLVPVVRLHLPAAREQFQGRQAQGKLGMLRQGEPGIVVIGDCREQ